MKIKLWNVVFGNHWASSIVSARNIKEAVSKAKKKEKPIPRDHSLVTKVELIAEES